MNIILAEKPEVAATIAAALKEVRLSNGEILETKHLSLSKYERLIKEARKEGYFKGTRHIITFAYGHLFTLKEPDELDPQLKKWDMNTLPFFHTDIPLKMVPRNKFVDYRKQFSMIKSLFNDKNTEKIIVATDAGREGEHIFRTIYKESKSKKPFFRMWIKDMNEDGILQAYKTMKDGHLYDGLADAALCRAEGDFNVGMNMSRAMTLKFGGFKNVLSIGRVQTPTLAILVNREREIANFVPEDFYTIKAQFEGNLGSYEGTWFNGDQNRFADQKAAEQILQKVKGQDGKVTNLQVKEETERNPLLFNLTELQRAMNRILGLTAKQTLDIAQKLYDEHKLITYPRTSSRYLASGTGTTVHQRLQMLEQAFQPIVTPALKNSFASFMIDDSKTSDHEAIIPTLKKPDLSKLSKTEFEVYQTIVTRFVAAFFPVCKWQNSTVITTVNGETFKSSGKVLVQQGWRAIEGIPKTNTLPLLEQDEVVKNQETSLEKKKTQPPKRLTEDDLLGAMENAGKFIEENQLKELIKENGIGTPATRDNIIEELVKRGYVKREKKQMVPTGKGMEVIAKLPVELLKSPEMTARWEQKLGDIEQGKLTRRQFMYELQEALTQMINGVKGSKDSKIASTSAKTTLISKGKTQEKIAVCPTCGGDIVETEKTFSCNNWENGCKTTIWKNALERLGKKKITKAEAKQLFTRKITTKKTKLISPKTGKEFEAYLMFNGDGVKFTFNNK